jgi:hypothetical protein
LAASRSENSLGTQLKHTKSDDLSLTTASSFGGVSIGSIDDADTSAPTSPVAQTPASDIPIPAIPNPPHSTDTGSDDDGKTIESAPHTPATQSSSNSPVTPLSSVGAKLDKPDDNSKKPKVVDPKRRDKRTSFLTNMFRKKDSKDDTRNSPPSSPHEPTSPIGDDRRGSNVRHSPSTPVSPTSSSTPVSPTGVETPSNTPPPTPGNIPIQKRQVSMQKKKNKRKQKKKNKKKQKKKKIIREKRSTLKKGRVW